MSGNNLPTRVKEFIYLNMSRSEVPGITQRVSLLLGSMSEHIFLLSLTVYFGPPDDCLAGTEDNLVFFPFYTGRSRETGLQKKGQQILITYKQSICFTHPRIKVSFVCGTGSVSQACRLTRVHEFKTTKRSKSGNRTTCPCSDIYSPIPGQQPEQTDHRTKERTFSKNKGQDVYIESLQRPLL